MLAVVTLMLAAASASAQTFYVEQRGGNDTNPCTSQEKACETIRGAIKKAEAVTGPNRIEVEPGEGINPQYEETVELLNTKDNGLTINGDGPEVVIEGKKNPALVVASTSAVTISNVKLRTGSEPPTRRSAVFARSTALTFDSVKVENTLSNGENGVELREAASLTMNGGSVEMAGGSRGLAVSGRESPIALNSVSILNTGQAEGEEEAGGVNSEKSSLSLTNTHISVESSPPWAAVDAEKDTSVQISNSVIRQNGAAPGADLAESPVTVNGLRVEMVNASNQADALIVANEGYASTLSHLDTTGGTWTGPGLIASGGDMTLIDSRLITSSQTSATALRYVGLNAHKGLLIQRSVLQAGPNAKPGALQLELADATIDSSEVLGGLNAIYFEAREKNAALTLTVSASTIDAGVPGTAADTAGTTGIEALSSAVSGSAANVAIQGSIVLEKQIASYAAGDTASVGCSYSAVPSQSQSAGAGAGAISCANATNGNTEASPLSSLFPEPLSGYQLSPGSGAVDSVPASAIALPAGITPSPTDLEGHPRVVDGNGDCVAVQDKGALELQGHSACPVAVLPINSQVKASAGVLSHLALSPSAFYPAPSGATISSSKRKYGTRITYADSQAATTTFTVLKQSTGRRQGSSCRKLSRSNSHGKRCKLLTKVGAFTHADRAGTASALHFSGRVRGKRLSAGLYTLQAAASNAAGRGPVATAHFTIR